MTIGGRTLLEIALTRLRSFGVGEAIVNVHHFADQIVAYLAANRNFDMRIEVSHEKVLLDTGGGLKKAAWFFLKSGEGPRAKTEEPFLVHNVDVLSSINLARTWSSFMPNTAHSPRSPSPRGRLRGRCSSTRREVKVFGLADITAEEPAECISAQVLQGLKKPTDCPAFGSRCTPENPLGAPMVSSEGACAAYYHYRRHTANS